MMNAFVDKDGVLTAFGFAESNNDDTLVTVEENFSLDPGAWRYEAGNWVQYVAPPTLPQLQAQRAALLAAADNATAGMADAYVAGILDEADTARFKSYAAYKLAISKVDLTAGPVVWPTPPEA